MTAPARLARPLSALNAAVVVAGAVAGAVALTFTLTLAGCSSAPPQPDWQLNAKGALDRASVAYLAGNSRVEAAEFARARAEVARTGRIDLLARVELARCAWRVASLVFEDCAGFDALAADAAAAERAYAAYLVSQGQAGNAALLPLAQQAVASAGSAASAEAVAAIEDPLSRLVAAGVLLRGGRTEPAAQAKLSALSVLAAETASAQGWSRPLAAWLNVQLLAAEAAGNADAAARVRRRIAAVLGPAGPEVR